MKIATFRSQLIQDTKTNCEANAPRRKFVAHCKAGKYEAILTCEWQTNFTIGIWNSPRQKWPIVYGVNIKNEQELNNYLTESIKLDSK